MKKSGRERTRGNVKEGDGKKEMSEWEGKKNKKKRKSKMEEKIRERKKEEEKINGRVRGEVELAGRNVERREGEEWWVKKKERKRGRSGMVG